MPQQLITGTDCCPCSCPDTVNLTQNITNIYGSGSTVSTADPVVLGTEIDGALWINTNTGSFWYFYGGKWNQEIGA